MHGSKVTTRQNTTLLQGITSNRPQNNTLEHTMTRLIKSFNTRQAADQYLNTRQAAGQSGYMLTFSETHFEVRYFM
jgi:hypothetical protein